MNHAHLADFQIFLFKQSMYYIRYLYQYSDRLQFEVTITSTSATSFRHTTSITEISLAQTYIARTIRPTLRTLYSTLSPVLLSFDVGGVRDYPVDV